MRETKGWAARLAVALAVLTGTSAQAQTPPDNLEARIERLESVKAIERLQGAFGYYIDRFLFDQPPNMFASEGVSVEWEGGVWRGEEGVQRFWQGYMRAMLADGTAGPVAGRAFEQPQLQGMIDIAPDGMSATARWRTVGRFAQYGEKEYWAGGINENRYVREGGVWKFRTMRYCTTWSASYAGGWQDAQPAVAPPQFTLAPADRNGPDAVIGGCPARYPDAGLLAFHFSHPVTGAPVATERGQ